MKRLTTRTPDGVTVSDLSAALERLAAWEDILEELVAEREQIALELEALRAQGKTKSLRFKEQFARKIPNREMLSRFGGAV